MDTLIECASLGFILDIPIEMINLKNQNRSLTNINLVMRNILIFTAIGAVVITIIVYKKKKDDKSKSK